MTWTPSRTPWIAVVAAQALVAGMGGCFYERCDCSRAPGSDAGPRCGDQILDGVEACEQEDLGGADCTTLGKGYVGGTLGCAPDCTFDVSGCASPPGCGDGLIAAGEECDGDELGSGSCTTLGFDAGGELRCAGGCVYDVSGCGLCGDGSATGPEACDGADLAGANCVTIGQGFTGGMLACAGDCAFATAGCVAPPECGNGAIDVGEQCDGAELADTTCEELLFAAGVLRCFGGCVFDTTGCYTCGDGAVQGPETCDGAWLAGESCLSLGHDGGALACAPGCLALDESGCTDCGDGVAEGAEVCDGLDLRGEDSGAAYVYFWEPLTLVAPLPSGLLVGTGSSDLLGTSVD